MFATVRYSIERFLQNPDFDPLENVLNDVSLDVLYFTATILSSLAFSYRRIDATVQVVPKTAVCTYLDYRECYSRTVLY
jgi:hypothetical protein